MELKLIWGTSYREHKDRFNRTKYYITMQIEQRVEKSIG